MLTPITPRLKNFKVLTLQVMSIIVMKMSIRRRLMAMKNEKKQEKLSMQEQVKLYLKLMKEGRLPLDSDDIRASYPRMSEKQKKD